MLVRCRVRWPDATLVGRPEENPSAPTARHFGAIEGWRSAHERIVGVPLQRRSLRLDADLIVHGATNPLFTAEISFGCLHGDMSKQESESAPVLLLADWHSFAHERLRSWGASPVKPSLRCILFHHVRDHPFSHAFTPAFSGAADATKHPAA